MNAGFCGSHSDCCVSRWSVTKWAITLVGLAIYYWYESQTTRRRQWFMLKHFNPNCYFDILWPMLHKILQSILFLYSFAKAVFLIGSILSVSFWQLWEFLNNWWRPWVTEFLGRAREQRKLDLLFRRHRDNKEVKWQNSTGALKGFCKKVYFLEHPGGRGQRNIRMADKIHPSCDEIARKMCVRLSSITIKQQRLRAH